jgi:phosphoadenosine phosphosulfate reductase
VKVSEEYEIAIVRTPKARAKVFGGGQVSVTADTEKDAEAMFGRTVKALIRSALCTSCGICEKACARHAITIKNGLHVDPEKCNSCGKCEKSCMVVHYYDKIMAGKDVSVPAPGKAGPRNAPRDGKPYRRGRGGKGPQKGSRNTSNHRR